MGGSVSCELSAAVLVYNGIATIARCLESLSFCDEVLVVDDCSTDGSWEYLKTLNLRSVQHRHTTMAAQREYARRLVQGRWLLTMDADEYVTPELASAIRRSIGKPKPPDGFSLLRKNPFPKGLRGFHWTRHPRLVRTDRCRWVDTDSPHSPLLTTGLRIKSIRGAYLDHEPIASLPAYLRKSINRSLILAAQQLSRGRRAGVFRLLVSSIGRFFKSYFRNGAFRHGRDGFLWACLAAFEAFSKYTFIIGKSIKTLEQALDEGPGSYPKGAPLAVSQGKENGG